MAVSWKAFVPLSNPGLIPSEKIPAQELNNYGFAIIALAIVMVIFGVILVRKKKLLGSCGIVTGIILAIVASARESEIQNRDDNEAYVVRDLAKEVDERLEKNPGKDPFVPSLKKRKSNALWREILERDLVISVFSHSGPGADSENPHKNVNELASLVFGEKPDYLAEHDWSKMQKSVIELLTEFELCTGTTIISNYRSDEEFFAVERFILGAVARRLNRKNDEKGYRGLSEYFQVLVEARLPLLENSEKLEFMSQLSLHKEPPDYNGKLWLETLYVDAIKEIVSESQEWEGPMFKDIISILNTRLDLQQELPRVILDAIERAVDSPKILALDRIYAIEFILKTARKNQKEKGYLEMIGERLEEAVMFDDGEKPDSRAAKGKDLAKRYSDLIPRSSVKITKWVSENKQIHSAIRKDAKTILKDLEGGEER